MCLRRFVELDRCAAAAEHGYAVGLFKVLGAESMAKNDLLVGLPAARKVGFGHIAVPIPSSPAAAGDDGAGSNNAWQQGLLMTAEEMGFGVL